MAAAAHETSLTRTPITPTCDDNDGCGATASSATSRSPNSTPHPKGPMTSTSHPRRWIDLHPARRQQANHQCQHSHSITQLPRHLLTRLPLLPRLERREAGKQKHSTPTSYLHPLLRYSATRLPTVCQTAAQAICRPVLAASTLTFTRTLSPKRKENCTISQNPDALRHPTLATTIVMDPIPSLDSPPRSAVRADTVHSRSRTPAYLQIPPSKPFRVMGHPIPLSLSHAYQRPISPGQQHPEDLLRARVRLILWEAAGVEETKL